MKIADYRHAVRRIEPDAEMEQRLRKKLQGQQPQKKPYRMRAAAAAVICVLAAAIAIPAMLTPDKGDMDAPTVTPVPSPAAEPSRQIVYAETVPGTAMNECVPDGGDIYLAMSMDEAAMLDDPAYADALFSLMIFPYHAQEYYGNAFDGFMLDGWTAEALRARINTLAAECDAIWGECVGKGEEEPPEVEWYDPRDEAQRARFDPEGKYPWLAEYAGRLPVTLPAQWYTSTDEVIGLEAKELQLIHARSLYVCQQEAQRLQKEGVFAEAVSLLDGSLIFVHVLAGQEQIRALPYSGVLGYYIRLAPESFDAITEMMPMDE